MQVMKDIHMSLRYVTMVKTRMESSMARHHKGVDRWGLRGLKPPQISDKTNSVVWERQK